MSIGCVHERLTLKNVLKKVQCHFHLIAAFVSFRFTAAFVSFRFNIAATLQVISPEFGPTSPDLLPNFQQASCLVLQEKFKISVKCR